MTGAGYLSALAVFLGLAGVADAQDLRWCLGQRQNPACRALISVTEQPTPGVDRPGGDYSRLVSGAFMAVDTAATCRAICFNDPRCQAWTFVNPGVQGPDAVCWLKSSVPPAVNNPCCTSGVVVR